MRRYALALGLLLGAALALGIGGCGDTSPTNTGPTDVNDTDAPTVSWSWTALEPVGTAPSPRFGSYIFYDSQSRQVFLFGGVTFDQNPDGTPGEPRLLGDLWAYTPATNAWTELHPSGVPPDDRFSDSAYDAENRRLLLFGEGGAVISTYDLADERWTEVQMSGYYDGGTPYLKTSGAALVWVPDVSKVIAFGGDTSLFSSGAGEPIPSDQTWEYDPSTTTWSRLDPAGPVPPARLGGCIGYDPVNRWAILCGGSGTSGALRDTWAYDPTLNTWIELRPSDSTGPEIPFKGNLSYDPHTGKMICVDMSMRVCLYDLVANSWDRLKPATFPDPPDRDADPARTYDPDLRQVVLFGGQGYKFLEDGSATPVLLNDLWAFSLSTLSTTDSPTE